MTDLRNDPILVYKNFKMGTEIDIAGTFIFNGMKEMERMNTFHHESEVFAFLYNVAIGIERLQKVLIVLLEDVNIMDNSEFEESLKTHNHQELHKRINGKSTITFNSRENCFLQLLSVFYKKCRYDRFNISGKFGSEKKLLSDYIQNSQISYRTDTFSESIINNDNIKELFGRVIGSISKKYYSEICKRSTEYGIFTDELRHESKAEKIFLGQFRKNSLQEQTSIEKIAFKEFIIFLMNTSQKNSFIRYLKEIKPLDIDIAFANQYLGELSKGIVSQELMDTVESLYEEHGYSHERFQKIDLAGDEKVLFEYFAINKCNNMLKSLISGEYDCYKFATEFPIEIKYLDDNDEFELLKRIPMICSEFIKQHGNGIDTTDKFMDMLKEVHNEFKKYYCLN